MSKIAVIILDQNIKKTLDYRVPKTMEEQIFPGVRVEVPVRNTRQLGTVLSLKDTSSFVKLKEIEKIHGEEISLPNDLFELAKWTCQYYGASFQQVLKAMLPINVRKDQKQATKRVLSLKCSMNKVKDFASQFRQKYSQQSKVLDWFLKNSSSGFLSEVQKELKVSMSPIQSLIKKNILQVDEKTIEPEDFLQNQEFLLTPFKTLNSEQKLCFDAIQQSIQNQTFQPHLIHGVTGSGKTEVYLHCIREVLKLKKSVIILIPEIALTSQTIERFKARFDCPIAIMHHRRTSKQKMHDWKLLNQKKAQIVIGARSSIFSPTKDLGLIIVDEEHESSYKQSDSAPYYHARDIAVLRAKFSNCPVILASATPSLESLHNTEIGKYQLHTLKDRAEKQTLAQVKIVNMQVEYDLASGFTHFSRALIEGIKDRLEKGEQTLLFLNRRGYRTSIICQNCSTPLKCPHCDLSLTYHKGQNRFQCHLCDFSTGYHTKCPECDSQDMLEFKGFGTEHVEKALKGLFKEAQILRIDRDTTKNKHFLDRSLKQFRSGKADILIGTQMIAKGHHFPQVTLVGILNADSGLFLPDFRAQEHTFQKIVQVAGRSGRSELIGEVILQTLMPNNAIIQMAAKHDYSRFVKRELEERKTFNYPPFCHLIKCSFSGVDEQDVKQIGEEFYQNAKKIPNVEAMPLHPSGYAKLKNKYRYQFLIRTKTVMNAISKLNWIKQNFKTKISIQIDVDPQSTFF